MLDSHYESQVQMISKLNVRRRSVEMPRKREREREDDVFKLNRDLRERELCISSRTPNNNMGTKSARAYAEYIE